METSTFPNPPYVQACGATTPPQLPSQFHAVALLTPFTDSQLVVAEITYDWSVQAMRVTTYGLERGYGDFLYTQDGYYILDSVNGGDPKECFGPIQTSEKVPAPNWLATNQVTCNGIQDVLGVDTDWWCGLTANNNPPAPVPPTPCVPFKSANWFWMRTDNGYPWRMMFINTTNDYELPFIGRFAFVHFPTFEAVTSTNLPQIIQECTAQSTRLDRKTSSVLRIRKPEHTYNLVGGLDFLPSAPDRERLLGKIQDLIPGLTAPTGKEQPPSWPSTLFMTALTTPTFEPHPFANQPYPTQIYYDWPNQHQLTRFFLPDNSLEDVILTNTTSYLIGRYPDGTHKCLGTVPVGLPYTNWPTHAGNCTCKGVITNNPQLSPNKTTQIFLKDSQPPRFFWFWYTTANEAIMFAEVPQACNVELILTDYFDFDSTPPAFDPSLFIVPPDCLSTSPGKGQAMAAVNTPTNALGSQPAKTARKASARKVRKKATGARATRKALTRKVAKKAASRRSPKKKTAARSTRRAPARKGATKAVSRTRVSKTAAKKTARRSPARKAPRRAAARKTPVRSSSTRSRRRPARKTASKSRSRAR